MANIDRGILITFASRCVLVANGIGTSILISRLLGPTGRGAFFMAMTLSATLAQFLNLGIHSANTYLVAVDRDPKLLRGLLSNSVWIAIVLGGGGAVVAGGFVRRCAIEGLSAPLLWAGLAIAPPMLLTLFTGSLLLGIGRTITFNILQTAQALAMLAAVAGCFAAGADAATLAAATLAVHLLSAAVHVAVVAGPAGGIGPFHRPLFIQGVEFATRAYVVCALGFLLMRGNVFLLARWCGLEQTGYYSIGAQMADYLWLFPTAAATVLFPELVRDRSARWAQTKRILIRTAWLLAATGIVCAAATPMFVRIAYGAEFLPAVPAVWCLMPGVVFFGLSSVVSQYVAASGIPRAAILAWLATLAVLGACGAAAIPAWGAAGAGAAFSVAAAAIFGMLLAIAVASERADARAAPERSFAETHRPSPLSTNAAQ
ncbi:MAG: hypothetical protein FJ297_16485 [Planctomycetes bacterium]|nr:hypothetical protein [Planctomycetota bacterium]